MQLVEEGKPCHEIFQCDPDLLCSTTMEADFYNISRPYMAAADFVRDPLMWCICVGTSHDAEGGQIHAYLKTVYTLLYFLFVLCARVNEPKLVLAALLRMVKHSLSA